MKMCEGILLQDGAFKGACGTEKHRHDFVKSCANEGISCEIYTENKCCSWGRCLAENWGTLENCHVKNRCDGNCTEGLGAQDHYRDKMASRSSVAHRKRKICEN
jgi:hypothetical protein